ncbi:hypothetical protein D3C87_856610 [compost metagenome]
MNASFNRINLAIDNILNTSELLRSSAMLETPISGMVQRELIKLQLEREVRNLMYLKEIVKFESILLEHTEYLEKNKPKQKELNIFNNYIINKCDFNDKKLLDIAVFEVNLKTSKYLDNESRKEAGTFTKLSVNRDGLLSESHKIIPNKPGNFTIQPNSYNDFHQISRSIDNLCRYHPT